MEVCLAEQLTKIVKERAIRFLADEVKFLYAVKTRTAAYNAQDIKYLEFQRCSRSTCTISAFSEPIL
jgi:hypothetical protein